MTAWPRPEDWQDGKMPLYEDGRKTARVPDPDQDKDAYVLCPYVGGAADVPVACCHCGAPVVRNPRDPAWLRPICVPCFVLITIVR